MTAVSHGASTTDSKVNQHQRPVEEELRSKPSGHLVEYLLALSHIFKTLSATNKGIVNRIFC